MTNRQVIHQKIRHKISGTSKRPRIAVFRSLRSVSAQAIDDRKRVTIASAHTTKGSHSLTIQAERVGLDLAKQLAEKKINTAVFDRGGFAYHGVVKRVADVLREKGITI